MADKDIKIKVIAEADSKKLDDLKNKVENLDGEDIDLDVNANDKELKNLKKDVKDIDGENIDVDVNADDTDIRNVNKEINDLKGETIELTVHVDDSEIKKASSEVSHLGRDLQNSLGSTESAITGLVSTMAGKSIWDTVYGTSKKAETNKVLLRNMADTTISYDTLYDTIDKTTDESLISMQSLIPALNAIQSATNATGETMNQITPQVAEFGQYVLALYGSEALAESAMMDLSKGLKGACASLDQYGITEDALKNTGLWTGEEEDVIGFMNAVDELDGETNKLMDTAQGLEALMGKAFSRGGKRLGETVLPAVKGILKGFMQMDTATSGWLSTSLLAIGGVMTGLTSFLSVAGQAINGVKMIGESLKWLRDIEIMEGISGLFAIGWLLLLIAIGVALGLLFIYLYNNVDGFREGVDYVVASLQGLVNYIGGSVMGTVNWLSELFQNFTTQMGLNANSWTDAVLGFILFLPQLPYQLGIAFVNAIAKAMGFGNNFVQTMWNAGVNAVNGFINSIKQMAISLWQELQAMLKMAQDFAMRIADALTFGGASMVTGWQYGSGEHSPGYMYKYLVEELTEMEKAPQRHSSKLVSGISSLGSSMVDEFEGLNFNLFSRKTPPSQLSSNLATPPNNINEGEAKNPVNITINIDSVDKKERIDEIVNAIKQELYWDNSRAGRTV